MKGSGLPSFKAAAVAVIDAAAREEKMKHIELNFETLLCSPAELIFSHMVSLQ